MSKYTDYEHISRNYDDGRVCDGVDVMTSILVGVLKKPAGQIHILEAGCGTGNYSLGFLQNGIGKVTMIDASIGMLENAKSKVQIYGERVAEIKQHELPSLPFADESFDVVTLIQVIHHLDTCHLEQEMVINGKKVNDEISKRFKYQNLQITIQEAHRVLKPNGILLIDHCFQSNIDASWISLAPKALSLLKLAFINEGDLINMLEKEKFENLLFVQRPDSQILKTELTNNIEGILDKKWRNFDSGWSFAERTGELPDIIQLIMKKKDEGKLTEFVHDLNKLQRIVGSHTTLFCQKST